MAKKILTKTTVASNNVSQLPNIVKDQSVTLKQAFDQYGEDNNDYINDTLTEELQDSSTEGSSGAHAIGLNVPGLNSDNVGDGVQEIKEDLDGVVLGQIPNNSLTPEKLTPLSRTLFTNKAYANTGTADALVVTTDGQADYTVDNWIVTVTPVANNTGTSTVNVDSQGVKSIKKVVDGAYVDTEAEDFKDKQDAAIRWSVANDFFILAPKGADGNISWLRLYETLEANNVIKDDSDKDVPVKVDEYVYSEFHETKIQGDGSVLIPNTDFDTWKTLSSPSEAYRNLAYDSIKNRIYAVSILSPYSIFYYDIAQKKWFDTGFDFAEVLDSNSGVILNNEFYSVEASSPWDVFKVNLDTGIKTVIDNPTGLDLIQPTLIGTDIYFVDNTNDNKVVKYDTLLSSWNTSLATTVNNIDYITTDGTDIYAGNTATNGVSKYTVGTNSWVETGASPSSGWTYMGYSNGKIYVRDSVSLTNVWEYDVLTNTWDETFSTATNSVLQIEIAEGKVYGIDNGTGTPLTSFDPREQVDFQVIPPVTQATSSDDLKATVAGTLEMNNPEDGDVHVGFISKVDLWKADMEGASPSWIKSIQHGSRVFNSTTEIVTLAHVLDDYNYAIVLLDYYGTTTQDYSFYRTFLLGTVVSNTTMELTKIDDSNYDMICKYTVIEVDPNAVKQFFYNQTAIGSGTAFDIAIPEVDMSKTLVFGNYNSANVQSIEDLRYKWSLELETETNIQWSRYQTATYNETFNTWLVEFL